MNQETYEKAVEYVRKMNKVSISILQRKFMMNYNGAYEIIKRMELDGIVSKLNNDGQRTILKGKSYE